MRRIVSIDAENGGFVVEIFDQKQEAENNKPSKNRGSATYKDPYKRYVFKESEKSNMIEFVEKAIEIYQPKEEASSEFDKAFKEFSKEEDDD